MRVRSLLLPIALVSLSTFASAKKPRRATEKKSPAPTSPAAVPDVPDAPAPTASTADTAPPAASPAPVAAPTPTPAPVETSRPTRTAAAELEPLKQEYDQLRDELFRARARAMMIGDAVLKTRLVATFKYEAQRAWPLKQVSLTLDDKPVYSADAPDAREAIKIFDGPAAPGKHVVALRIDCGATGEDRVAYGTENRFTIDIPADKQTRVILTVDETGDGPQPLARKHQGTFNVKVRAQVKLLDKDAP